VRDRLDEFGDAVVAVVTFSAPERVAAYQRDDLAPLTVLVDADRAAYRAFGMTRGSVRRVWGPKVWRAYARLLRRGRRLRRPTEDILQLGGDVVIGPDGTVTYQFRSEDPDDRPAVEELLAAVRATGTT